MPYGLDGELGTRLPCLPTANIRCLRQKGRDRIRCNGLLLQSARKLGGGDELGFGLSRLLFCCGLLRRRRGCQWFWPDDGSFGTGTGIGTPWSRDDTCFLKKGRRFGFGFTDALRGGRFNHHIGKFFDDRSHVLDGGRSSGDYGSVGCLACPSRNGGGTSFPPFLRQGLFGAR